MENVHEVSEMINGDTEIEIKIETPDGELEEEEEYATSQVHGKKHLPHYVNNSQSFNLWTSKATACLINQYKKYRSLVGQSNQFRSLRDMFDVISLEMQKYGFFFSPQKCENKWRVLERKYKNLVMRELMKKPGRMKHYGHWEHKRALDEIFNEKRKSVYLQESEYPPVGSSTKYALILPQAITAMAKAQTVTNVSLLKTNNVAEKTANATITEDPLSTESNATRISSEASESPAGPQSINFETILIEMRKLFDISEKNKERRHKEKMSVRQNKLKVQQKILKIKEQKLELERKKILAMAQEFQMSAQ